MLKNHKFRFPRGAAAPFIRNIPINDKIAKKSTFLSLRLRSKALYARIGAKKVKIKNGCVENVFAQT